MGRPGSHQHRPWDPLGRRQGPEGQAGHLPPLLPGSGGQLFPGSALNYSVAWPFKSSICAGGLRAPLMSLALTGSQGQI